MTDEQRALWVDLRRYLLADAEQLETKRRSALGLAKAIERLYLTECPAVPDHSGEPNSRRVASR